MVHHFLGGTLAPEVRLTTYRVFKLLADLALGESGFAILEWFDSTHGGHSQRANRKLWFQTTGAAHSFSQGCSRNGGKVSTPFDRHQ
jgi:hypothetical protein